MLTSASDDVKTNGDPQLDGMVLPILISVSLAPRSTVSISEPAGWMDRKQVGFPRANWW